MDEVLRCFGPICDPTGNPHRAQAEQRLQELSRQAGYALVLAQIFINKELNIDIRQLAGVLLQQYIRHHWDRRSSKFTEPQIGEEEKQLIKQQIPACLGDSAPRIRTTTAVVLASIAHWDWPAQWPGLIEELVRCLQARDNPNLVSGAITALDEFASGGNLASEHVPPLLQVIFSNLLTVLASGTLGFGEIETASALRVVFNCLEWVAIVKRDPDFDSSDNNHVTLVKTQLQQWVPQWIEYLLARFHAVPITATGLNVTAIVTCQIFALLINEFPNVVKKFMPRITAAVWQCLVTAQPLYESHVVQANALEGHDTFSGGHRVGLKVLVSDALDVLYETAQRKRFVPLLHAQLSPLLAMLMSLAQLTAEESEDFEEAGEQLLVSEQADGPFGLGLRATAAVIVREVVASSDAELRATGLRELMQALSRVIGAAAEAQQRAVEGWWRAREAAVFVVGVTLCNEDQVLLQVGEHFQLSSFVQQVVVPDLHLNAHTMLQSRALWFGARMSSAITGEQCIPFLQLAAHVLSRPHEPLAKRINAMRVVSAMLSRTGTDKNLIRTVLRSVIDGMTALIEQLDKELILAALEPLEQLLDADEESTREHLAKLMDLLLKVWAKFHDDPYASDLIRDCFNTLCKQTTCLPFILQHLPGPLLALLSHEVPGVIDTSMAIVGSMITYSTCDQLVAANIVQTLLPRVFQLMQTSQDRSVLESGVTVLTQIIRVCRDKLFDWTIANHNAVALILNVTARLLGPEFQGIEALTNIGDLATKLITVLGARLGDTVVQMLEAVLHALHRATTSPVVSTLLVVFATLLIHHRAHTLAFLHAQRVTVTQPDHSTNTVTGLEYLMRMWTQFSEEIHGSYRIKLCCVALSQLVEHADPLLDQLQVPGDAPQVQGRQTRAKKTQAQVYMEPLRVRIIKLLTRDLGIAIEDEEGDVESIDSREEDDDDWLAAEDDLDVITGVGANGKLQLLSDLLSKDDVYDEIDEEDPDVLADPIYNIKLREYLIEFFRRLAGSNRQLLENSMAAMNEGDRAILQIMALLIARLTQKISKVTRLTNPILRTKNVRFSTQTANNQLNQARNNRVPTHNKRDSKLTRPVLKSESERTYQQLYNQLTEAQRNNDTARVEQTFNTMRDSPHLNYSLFNSMFKYYLTTQQYDKGVQLYKSMTDLLERTSNKWLTPRITTAVLVLELLMRAREITLLYELIDLKLAAYHINPLDDIVSVCLKHDMPEAAVRVIESNKALLDTPAMTHLIIKLLQAGNESQAMRYYRQMCVVGPAPNEVTFRELLLFFAKNRHMDRIVQLLHDLHEHKFTLDSGTYTNVIRLMGMENESETRALLSPVIHAHRADTRTFNIMLALNKDNKLPVEYSLRLYNTMLAEHVTPNVITYNTLFKQLHESGNTEHLPRLLQEMRTHGVEFNEFTYGILAHAYVRARQYDLAMQTLHEAESRGVRVNVELFNIKLMTYRAQGDMTKLRQLFFVEMPRANITPDAYSWSILLTASFKYETMEDAEKLVELLQKSNVAKSVVNDVLYSHMIHMYKRKGQSDKITQLYLEQIKPRNKSIDRRLHTDLIESMPPSLHLVEVINMAITKYGDFAVPLPVFHDTIRWLRQERSLNELRQLFRTLSIMGAKCHLPSQTKLLADIYGHVLLALIENDQSAAEIYAVFDQAAVQKLNLAGDVLESFVNLLVTRGDTANLTRVITLISSHHVTLSAIILSRVIVVLAKNNLWPVIQQLQQLIEEQLPNLEIEAIEHLIRISAANQVLELAHAANEIYKSRATSVNMSLFSVLLALEAENGSKAILALLERTQPPFPVVACSAEELKRLLRVAAEQRKLEWAQRLITHNTAVTDLARVSWFVKHLPVTDSESTMLAFTEWWESHVGRLQGEQYSAAIEGWGRLKSLKHAVNVYRAAEQQQSTALISAASALLEVFIRAQVLALKARVLQTQLSSMSVAQVQEAMQSLITESQQQINS